MFTCKNWSRYSRTRAKVCQHVDKNWQIFDNDRTWRCATPNKPAETEAGFLSAAKWAYVSSASKNSSRTLRGDRKLASSLHFLRRISLSSYSSRKDRTRIETSRNVKWFWLSQLRLRRCPFPPDSEKRSQLRDPLERAGRWRQGQLVVRAGQQRDLGCSFS